MDSFADRIVDVCLDCVLVGEVDDPNLRELLADAVDTAASPGLRTAAIDALGMYGGEPDREIIRGLATSDATYQTTVELCAKMEKTTIY